MNKEKKDFRKIGLVFLCLAILTFVPSMSAQLDIYSDRLEHTGDTFFYLNSTETVYANSGWNFSSNVNISGTLDIIHTAIDTDDHALELDVDAAGFGDVKAVGIDYISGAIAQGQDEGIILVNIDETLATGGDIFGIEVLATDGSAGIYGLKTGVLIGPIHQDSGTFANPTTGTDNTPATDVPAMIDGNIGTTTAIFEADNEYIIIGVATAFEEMEFILTTEASVNIKPTFWYSTAGAGQFTQFTPVDGTNGFKNTGVVAWDASDLVGHTTNDDTGTYDIKVIRTKNVLVTSPILGYAKTAATTEYIWDKNGNLTVNSVTAENATFTYVDKFESTAPATPPANTLRLYVEAIHGFSFYKFLDDTGMKRQLVRDSMILVKNIRGTTIAANRIVFANGSEDNVPTVDLADASNLSRMPAIGVTIESIADGDFGRVMQIGLLENINTNSLTEGDVLYVSDTVPGTPMTTQPLSPSLTQEIGTVLVKSATVGAIQIISRSLNGDEFGTINNFTIQRNLTVVDNAYINNISSDVNISGDLTVTGDVGIGTTDPIVSLHGTGAAAFGSAVATLGDTDNGHVDRIFNIIDPNAVAKVWRYTTGTGDPGVELIWGTGATDDADGNYYWDFYVEGADGSFNIRDRSFGQGDARRFVIEESGEVGIGETAPSAKLEVNGDILVKDKIAFTQDDKNEFIDSLSNGHVDIGATTSIDLNQDTSVTGDVTLTGELKGSRHSIIFTLDDSTLVNGVFYLKLGEVTCESGKGMTAIRAGSIVGLSINYDVTAHAGLITFALHAYVNGASVWSNAIDFATHADDKVDSFTQARNTDQFSAEDVIGAVLAVTGIGSVTVNEVIVELEYYYDT